MTAHKILQKIMQNRAVPLNVLELASGGKGAARKIDEIEWAVQAIAEYLRDQDEAAKALLK